MIVNGYAYSYDCHPEGTVYQVYWKCPNYYKTKCTARAASSRTTITLYKTHNHPAKDFNTDGMKYVIFDVIQNQPPVLWN
ncbi:unnamed protein product [Callosobruchus maculatus]|uniref:FLYWCH-type domain-containing protein n=1 Tax=Callosobruchus maculatus TaxID=64391 RepID=A0A653CPI8_CALMS|nr:unnamed protein product [Callosobruchus maculatus]